MEHRGTTVDPLLSLRQTQEVLGLSRQGVWRLVSVGDLPGVELGGRRLIQSSDLREFIAARKVRRGQGSG